MIVALPIAALVWQSRGHGLHAFWAAISTPEAVAALRLTFETAAIAALVNAVLGTVIAWVLVRDEFRGKSLMNAVIDLPFALPTIVAGLVLLTFYGPRSPVGVHIAFTREALLVALLFVTLPFVIRTVQPVLMELDVEMEEAARSLGAGQLTVFRRIVLPSILPGILSGVTMAFARAVGEIGAVVLITGKHPVQERGRLRLHLQPDPELQLPGRLRRGRRAARGGVPRPARGRRDPPLRHEVRACVRSSSASWRSATCS